MAKRDCLETFSVYDGWSRFVILLLWDPHLLEGGERSQNGATDPYGVLSLWWSDDLDLHCGWGKGSDFLLHPVGNTWVHGGATRQYIVGVQVFPDVHIALHYGVVAGLMNTSRLHTWGQKRNFKFVFRNYTSQTEQTCHDGPSKQVHKTSREVLVSVALCRCSRRF